MNMPFTVSKPPAIVAPPPGAHAFGVTIVIPFVTTTYILPDGLIAIALGLLRPVPIDDTHGMQVKQLETGLEVGAARIATR